ncbi:MAG: glycosyltransferase family 4 protein [Verrucomicrobiota bacterium]
MKPPKISVLTPDVGSNSIAPSTVMGSILSRHYEVEIIGPDLGTGVNEMYRSSFDYTTLSLPRLYRVPDFFLGARQLAKAITGDVIFAVKAFADTLPIALWEKMRRGRKVILYLDEWDGAVYYQKTRSERLRDWLTHLHHPMHECYAPWVERMVRHADEVLSTTTFLQKKFGGQVVHYGIDCDRFKPQPPDQTAELKASLGLDEVKLIVFGGVARPHKGVDQILEALAALDRKDVKLLVVGPHTDYLEGLKANPAFADLIRCTGAQPKEEMPTYLDLADGIVIPLASTLLSNSQMPCKIFEAMAMAKPIIGSRISDLPIVLEGCGWTYPAGDIGALADAIGEMVDNPEASAEKGRLARRKCLDRFSLEVTEKLLLDVMKRVTEG